MELSELLNKFKEELLYYVEVKLHNIEDKIKLHPNTILFNKVFSLIKILKICDETNANTALQKLDIFGTGRDELKAIVTKYNNNRHTQNVDLNMCLSEYKEMKRIIFRLYKSNALKRMFETFRIEAKAKGMPDWNIYDQIIKCFFSYKSPLVGKFTNVCTIWEHAIVCECGEPHAESAYSIGGNIYDQR